MIAPAGRPLTEAEQIQQMRASLRQRVQEAARRAWRAEAEARAAKAEVGRTIAALAFIAELLKVTQPSKGLES